VTRSLQVAATFALAIAAVIGWYAICEAIACGVGFAEACAL
jgi:hypothetical protein